MDTGMGMDPKTAERIFEPFFTTKEKGRGTGLGLASAYGIIKNHGGVIRVSSEKGIGTEFTICLPETNEAVAPEPDVEVEIIMGKEQILLIDDNHMIVDVGKQMLQSLGYRVLTAGGGYEGMAIYKAQNRRIDLVILDMVMSDMNGSETFEGLKNIDPAVKVLLSSGYSINGQAADILHEKGVRTVIITMVLAFGQKGVLFEDRGL